MFIKQVGWMAVAALVVVAGAGFAPAAQAGDDAAAVQEILSVLLERGLIEEEQYTRLSAKNAKYEKQLSWAERLTFSGDFRARLEHFGYNRGEDGNKKGNRTRGRYRGRLAMKAHINDNADVYFRFVSGDNGTGSARSTNMSLGSGGDDFGTDDLNFDKAYVKLSPWKKGNVPGMEGTKFHLQLGKMGNPFRWKNGKDLLWDSDITPEGASAKLSMKVGESTKLYTNLAYYVIDEESSAKDPHLVALQFGGSTMATDKVEVGARLSWYRFDSLDSDFIGRANANGNSIDGLLGDEGGGAVNVIETGLYAKCKAIEGWPITTYATYFQNIDAEESDIVMDVGDEGIGWGAGIEVGDKKNIALFGLGYWYFEANSFPGVFIDADITDGVTNRSSWVAYAKRQIWSNTTAGLTFFMVDEIHESAGFGTPEGGDTIENAEHYRIQADLIFKF